MALLARLKIRVRLSIGFAMVVGLTGVIGTLGIANVRTIGDLTANLYAHPFTVTRALLQARVEMMPGD